MHFNLSALTISLTAEAKPMAMGFPAGAFSFPVHTPASHTRSVLL
jgi:hypothetical protein